MKRSEFGKMLENAAAASSEVDTIRNSYVRILERSEPDEYPESWAKVFLVINTYSQSKDPKFRITAHTQGPRGEWATVMHLTSFQLRNLAHVLEWFEEWKKGKHDEPFPDVGWLSKEPRGV